MNFPKEFLDFQNNNILEGKGSIAEGFKMVLYKTIPDYFELLDFENEDIFLEPLLFAHVNSSDEPSAGVLRQIMYGSIPEGDRPQSLQVTSDKYGNIYLPKLGWVTGVAKSTGFYLENIDGKYLLDGEPIALEAVSNDNKLGIELVKHHVELLASRFYDRDHNLLDVEIEEPYRLFHEKYNNTINFIEANVGWLASMISKCCFKSLIFSDGTDPLAQAYCRRNSFASFQVKGISFHNVYQPWYDEIFFLDDISHQMGHIVFDFLTSNKRKFYKVDPHETIKSNSEYGKMMDEMDARTFEILFHALYTYFLTLNTLDTAIESGKFSEFQKNEIIGRIVFYLRKSALDFETFESFEKNEIAAEIYTNEGLYIYKNMKRSFSLYCEKYVAYFNTLSVSNQTYNYNHRMFLEMNRLENVV